MIPVALPSPASINLRDADLGPLPGIAGILVLDR